MRQVKNKKLLRRFCLKVLTFQTNPYYIKKKFKINPICQNAFCLIKYSQMNPERNLPTICEIIHLQANDLQKLEDTNPAIKEKIANINSLLQKPTTILISDLFSLPTNQNPRVLGGRIGEICVAIRSYFLQSRNIPATIDPTITLYNKDLNLYED